MYTKNLSGLFFGAGISFGTLIFFLAATSARADTDWQPRFDRDGINIETRSFPGSRREEFRATVEVDASIAAALSLLQDYDAMGASLPGKSAAQQNRQQGSPPVSGMTCPSLSGPGMSFSMSR